MVLMLTWAINVSFRESKCLILVNGSFKKWFISEGVLLLQSVVLFMVLMMFELIFEI